MMNILLDFLTVRWKNGGGEWTRRVYLELFDYLHKYPSAVHLFALYDSFDGVAYEDMQKDVLNQRIPIKFVDVRGCTIPQIIAEYHIDRFFIAMSQVLGDYSDIDLAHVNCEVFCVTHDVCNEERYYNQMDYYYKFIQPKYQFENRREPGWMMFFHLKDSTPKLVKWLIQTRKNREREKTLQSMQRVMAMVCANPKVHLIAVSEYTRRSLQYNFGIPAEKISVFYSPERIYAEAKETIENDVLQNMVESGHRYYLLVNANRVQKNPYKAIHAFEKFVKMSGEETTLLALSYQGNDTAHVKSLPWLSDSDLANAYKHCYALIYPSFFEGFGYPPIEAMHYGKPVLCSYCTSMPDIFEDAPIWFSPLYETGIFEALYKLNDTNYEEYVKHSKLQYEKIAKRQQNDLQKLIQLLIS